MWVAETDGHSDFQLMALIRLPSSGNSNNNNNKLHIRKSPGSNVGDRGRCDNLNHAASIHGHTLSGLLASSPHTCSTSLSLGGLACWKWC